MATITDVDGVTIRQSGRFWGLFLYPAVAGAILRWTPGVLSFCLAAVAVLPFVIFVRGRSITITGDGMVLRTLVRRFIPWAQVRSLQVGELAGDRFVEVRLMDGSLRRLPAPVERYARSSGVDFEAKYAVIAEAWRVAQPIAADAGGTDGMI